VSPLKRLFVVLNGSTPQSGIPEYWDGPIPWVTPEDLGDLSEPEIRGSRRGISLAGYRSCGTSMAPAGSLVLSTRAPIGHLGIAAMPLCTNQGCRTLVSRNAQVEKYYFYLLLAARPELESFGQGSTFRELATTKLEDFRLAIPPEPERRAIASFLDRETAEIDALVARKERLIELLKEKRAALISRAVTKGLDLSVPMKDSGVEWIGRIPEHWEVRRLKTIASVQLSNVDKKSAEGQVPIRLCNYVDVYYNHEIGPGLDFMAATATPDQVRTFSLRAGDVLITKDSESWTDIAVPALVNEDLPDILCGYHLALIRPTAACLGDFLAHSFSAIGPREQFRVAANGVTRFGLGGDAIREACFAIPPIEEQRIISSYIDRETRHFEALTTRVRDGIARVKELRTALISAAVTGKIDVRDAH
jgi:type I restriction enzyme S subunit